MNHSSKLTKTKQKKTLFNNIRTFKAFLAFTLRLNCLTRSLLTSFTDTQLSKLGSLYGAAQRTR